MKQQPVLPDDTLLLLRHWIIIVAVNGCWKANRLLEKAAGAVFFFFLSTVILPIIITVQIQL